MLFICISPDVSSPHRSRRIEIQCNIDAALLQFREEIVERVHGLRGQDDRFLGGRIQKLSNDVYFAHGVRVQVNVFKCPTTEDATKIHASVLKMKGDPAYCLLMGKTVVEFVGQFDVDFAKRAARELLGEGPYVPDGPRVPLTVEQRDRGQHVATGTPWEEIGGYCRAVRRGNQVWIAGTTATHRDRLIGGEDPASQAHFVIDKIEGALRSLGGSLDDVVRTRIYVRESDDWEAVARVHGERFAAIRPANTLVRAEPIGEGYLVEFEAEAWLRD